MMTKHLCMHAKIVQLQSIYEEFELEAAPYKKSRHVMDMGEKAIHALQKLDDTGYSGHLSYILCMLDAPKFLQTCINGGFKPEAVRDFGKSHRIAINRMVSR